MALVVDSFQILEIAGVSQRVEINDFARRQLLKRLPDERGADEARAASDK